MCLCALAGGEGAPSAGRATQEQPTVPPCRWEPGQRGGDREEASEETDSEQDDRLACLGPKTTEESAPLEPRPSRTQTLEKLRIYRETGFMLSTVWG